MTGYYDGKIELIKCIAMQCLITKISTKILTINVISYNFPVGKILHDIHSYIV